MALDLDKYSVLIVDDVREMRTSLRTIAKSMGAQEVYEAKSGLEAIELLQAHNMDIVLCDYNLGEGRATDSRFLKKQRNTECSRHRLRSS